MGTGDDIPRPEYKEYIAPTRLLIQPDRQAFCYADPADRNLPPDAEKYNHNVTIQSPQL